MINALKYRIEYCHQQIRFYESMKSENDSQKMFNKGMLEGFKRQLKTLEELLITAKKLIELSETA